MQFLIDSTFAFLRFDKPLNPSKFELEIIKLGIFSMIIVEFWLRIINEIKFNLKV